MDLSREPQGDSSAVAVPPTLLTWERTTREAIRGLSGEHLTFQTYERALRIAQVLFDDPAPGRLDDCTAALVISHHNLADVLARRDDLDAAVVHLCDAHEAVMGLLLRAGGDAEMRRIALRHSRETHMALLTHVSACGPHPCITEVLRKACLALNAGDLPKH